MNDMTETSKSTKSLNDMTLDEIMEYRRVHDREIILAAAMKGAHVELKTLGEKKKHPFDPEYIRRG